MSQLQGKSIGLRPFWLGALALGASAVCATACVTSPRSNSTVGTSVHIIEFTGVVPYERGLQVKIQAKETNGTYTTLTTSSVPANGRWATTVDVPEKYFGGVCGKATFQVVTNHGAQVLKALRDGCIDTLGPAPTPADYQSCATEEIVVARGGAATFEGDLAIDGPAAAAAYQCLTAVHGSLNIKGGRTLVAPQYYAPGVAFSLPKLLEVSGDLSVDGDRAESVSLPVLATVGGNLSLNMAHFGTLVPPVPPEVDPTFAFPVTSIELPLLNSVGGNVELHNERENTPVGSASFHYNFSLPALTSLGGNVTVINSVFPAAIDGLNSLSTIHGDVLIDWGPTDLDSTTLLAGVSHVEGNFELIGPPNARVLMHGLTDVDGNLTVRARPGAMPGAFPRIGPNLLNAVASVGGDLTLDRTSASSPCTLVLTALMNVIGTVHITDGDGRGLIGATGASHLSMGSLEVTGTTSQQVPLHADAMVAPTGAIDFENNVALCGCQVDAFTAIQAGAGWLGTATNIGNGTSASCGTCPATFCP